MTQAANLAAPAFHESHLSAVTPEKEVRMVDDALLFTQAALVTESGSPSAIADAAEEARAKKHAFEMNKLSKRLHREVGEAITDFNMIEDGDKVMVCMSGGKDSYGMLDILMNLQKRAPIQFEIIAVNLDQKQPGFPEHVLPEYLTKVGVPFRIEEQDTYSVVKKVIPEGKTTCSLC